MGGGANRGRAPPSAFDSFRGRPHGRVGAGRRRPLQERVPKLHRVEPSPSRRRVPRRERDGRLRRLGEGGAPGREGHGGRRLVTSPRSGRALIAAAALLWSTGGLAIKLVPLTGLG